MDPYKIFSSTNDTVSKEDFEAVYNYLAERKMISPKAFFHMMVYDEYLKIKDDQLISPFKYLAEKYDISLVTAYSIVNKFK